MDGQGTIEIWDARDGQCTHVLVLILYAADIELTLS